MSSRRSDLVRFLAWFAVSGQVAFTVLWVIAGALEPGYSHLQQGVSELGGRFAEHAWLGNAAIVVLGLAVAALAPALLQALPRRPARAVSATLYLLVGAGIAVNAVLPLECSFGTDPTCDDRLRAGELSWETEAHVWSGLPIQILLLATPFAVARALWPRPIAPIIVIGGVFGLVFGVGTFLWEVLPDDGPDGLVQRLGLAVLHAWIALTAIGILHATRPLARQQDAVPAPPEFFDRAWFAEGEVILRPLFLWRRMGLRFTARRESRRLSDEAWIVEDEIVFADGSTQTRRMLCESRGSGEVQATGNFLPSDARMAAGPNGFRIWPYQLLVALGPVGILFDCLDESRMQADGTLTEAMDLGLIGISLARVTVRARALHSDASRKQTAIRPG